MKTHIFSSLLLLSLLAFTACSSGTPCGTASRQPNPDSLAAVAQYEAARASLDDLQASLAPPRQTFEVSGKRPSVVVGSKGTVVDIIPANLRHADGSPVKGPITVTLVECTDRGSLVGAGLQTVSNGRLLASAGSYFIDMQADGQPLQIKEGKSLNVMFPDPGAKGMELFYGETDSAGGVNWVEAGKKLKAEPDEPVEAVDTTFGDMWAFIDINDSSFSFENLAQYDYEMVDDRDSVIYFKAVSPAPGLVKWEASTPPSGSHRPNHTLGVNHYLPARINKLGWINCDRYLNDQNTVVTEYVPSNSTGTGLAWVVLEREMTILKLNYSSSMPWIPQDIQTTLPKGERVKVLIVEAQDGDNFLLAQKQLIAGDQQIVEMPLKPVPRTTVRDAITAL